MRQLTERGQLALLLLQKGFFEELLTKAENFIENSGQNPDIFYGVFYQPDQKGNELLLLELIVENSDGEEVLYQDISLDAARLEGGKLFDSIFNQIWPKCKNT
ncbi:hypothetical protein [Algoriphagus formosus]|uniref:hypothetical protein n=1 Tax=Algoriphagus formosus TaxID=2007308 RepID=UPI003F6E78D7